MSYFLPTVPCRKRIRHSSKRTRDLHTKPSVSKLFIRLKRHTHRYRVERPRSMQTSPLSFFPSLTNVFLLSHAFSFMHSLDGVARWILHRTNNCQAKGLSNNRYSKVHAKLILLIPTKSYTPHPSPSLLCCCYCCFQYLKQNCFFS